MKTVFNTNFDVAHAFNLQQQNTGRNANNSLYFVDDTIYSYGPHYILAQFLTPEIILINNVGYSNTTARHISIITSATSDKKQLFSKIADATNVLKSLKTLRKDFDKKRYKNNVRNVALNLINHFNNSVHLLGGYLLSNRFDGSYYTSKEFSGINEINEICLFFNNPDTIAICLESEQKEIKAREKRQANKEKKERDMLLALKRLLPGKIAKFRNYEINSFTGSEFTYLRFSKDLNSVETSQGVKIDINEALSFYNLILKGENMTGKKISHYTTLENNSNFIRIGCHKIDKSEVINIGEQLSNYANNK